MSDPIRVRVHNEHGKFLESYEFWCLPPVGAVVNIYGREVVVKSCYLYLHLPNRVDITVEDVKEYG